MTWALACLVVVGCGAKRRVSAEPDTAPAMVESTGDPNTVSSPACEAMAECAQRGRCYAVAGIPEMCVAGSDVRCAQSTVCTTQGRCHAQHPTEEQVRQGVTASAWDCVAAGPEDCRRVELCKSGACEIVAGSCVVHTMPATCRDTEACKDLGLCVLRDGVCVLGSDADCLASKACRRDGACVAGPERCEARTGEHCSQSDVCKTTGRCSPDGQGSCGFDKQTDCRKYEACRRAGACSLRAVAVEPGRGPKVWRCTAASSADCRQSEECRLRGVCSYSVDTHALGECRAASDADCARSQDCKDKGACRLVTNEDGTRSCRP